MTKSDMQLVDPFEVPTTLRKKRDPEEEESRDEKRDPELSEEEIRFAKNWTKVSST